MNLIEFLFLENAGISYSKESLETTIKDIIKNKDEKSLLRWIGLAGGKEKLMRMINNLSSSFKASIPAEFYKLVDKVSKDWRAIPRNRNIKVYGELK